MTERSSPDIVDAWKAEALRRFGPIPDGNGENTRLIAGYHYAFVEGAKAATAQCSAATVTVPVDAIVNLVNHQQQCDMDGVMVQVSRQALCEVLAYVTEVRPDNKWADGVAQRPSEPLVCLRCGTVDAFGSVRKEPSSLSSTPRSPQESAVPSSDRGSQ